MDDIEALRTAGNCFSRVTNPIPKVAGDAYKPAVDWYVMFVIWHITMGFELLGKGLDTDARYRFCLAAQYLEDAPVVIEDETLHSK